MSDDFFTFVYLSFMCIILFKTLIKGIYLVINGIPIILCLISVIWNFCLKGLLKSFFVPMFGWVLILNVDFAVVF